MGKTGLNQAKMGKNGNNEQGRQQRAKWTKTGKRYQN